MTVFSHVFPTVHNTPQSRTSGRKTIQRPWILFEPAGHRSTHVFKQPSASSVFASSHSSVTSTTPSPHAGFLQTVRHVFDRVSEFSAPASHSSSDSMIPLPQTLTLHLHVHPSRSSAFPSSQASFISFTPSPQNGERQFVLHRSATSLLLPDPSSHCSESCRWPSPQTGSETPTTVHVREHPSPSSPFPSSHSSPAWIQPSPQTGNGRSGTDELDGATKLLD